MNARPKASTFLAVFLLLAFVANASFAQSASIQGTVFDEQTGDELVGAHVVLKGTSLGSATNFDGKYLIPNVKPGTYVIEAGYIGYASITDTLVISPGVDIVRDFELVYTELEGAEIVVTAQAQGQLAAINRQLSEKSLVNIVSSDRIEELPDANAAESVSRIPGITVQREGGEGNKVVVRGLSPKYNAVSVNGVRLAATDSSNRSTDLSMVSQYMLEGIEVTKAGTPDQDADVLGGTVNFKLKKAEPGFNSRLIAQSMYNDLRDSYDDYKFVFTSSKRFWDERLGVLGLIDLEKRDRSSYELGASYTNPNAQLDSLNALRSTGFQLYDISRLNDRTNGLFVADLRIPNGIVSYSFLSSSIQSDRISHFESYGLGARTREMTSGDADVETRVKTHIVEYEQTIAKKLNVSASFSRAVSLQQQDDFYFRFRQEQAFTANPLGESVTSVQSLINDNETAMWPDTYSLDIDDTEERDRTVRLDLSYDIRLANNLSGAIKVGAKNRNKSRDYDRGSQYGRLNNAPGGTMEGLSETFEELGDVPLGYGVRRFPIGPFVDEEYSSEGFFDGDFTLGPFPELGFAREVFDYMAENFSNAGYWEDIAHTFHQTNSNLFDYSGTENYLAGYAMADMDIGPRLNIVSGVRWEKNKTTYTAWQGWADNIPSFSFSGYEKVERERENVFMLPALFVRFRPVDGLELRFAKTRTLSRPNYTDLIPLANYIGASKSVNYRNPTIEPAVSDNIDLSASITQNYLGFVSVGYFRKNISDLIFSSGRRYIEDPENYGLPEELETGFIQNYVSNNPNDVTLSGLEFDYQTRFWYLPSFLSGLVFNANYTVTSSEVKYPRTVIEFQIDYGPPLRVGSVNVDSVYVDRLIDQPNHITNMSLGYDYRGFSARFSVVYRSDIFRQTNFWPELRQASAAFRRYDLSIKQTLPVKGMDLYLNVSNITSSEDINEMLNQTRALSSRQNYGRTIDLGVRYAF
jgi:TonB-dependent receptor